MFLPKKVAWSIFLLLLYFDLGLTWVVGGGHKEGNLLWQPLVVKYGFGLVSLLVPVLFLLFIAGIKIVAWVVTKVDRTPNSEEILSTTLVIVYATYDFYLFFLLPRFGYLGTKTHRILIPVLIIPGIIYALSAQYLTKKPKK